MGQRDYKGITSACDGGERWVAPRFGDDD